MAWNGYLSLSASRLLPNYEFVGLRAVHDTVRNERWWVALKNLGIFGTLFVGGGMAMGLLLAILLDQKVRAEGCCAPSTCTRWR
jgi:glucose/mannose transport system permease protein